MSEENLPDDLSEPAEPDLAGLDLAGPDLAGPDLAGPDLAGPESAHFQMPPVAGEADKASGWEEVAEGRFMPRRVRGSCHGRALG
jgi:hypothetical protein